MMNEPDKDMKTSSAAENSPSAPSTAKAGNIPSEKAEKVTAEERPEDEKPEAKEPAEESSDTEEAKQARASETVEAVGKTAKAAGEAAVQAIGAVGKTAGELGGRIAKSARRYETPIAAGDLGEQRHVRLAHLTYLLYALGPLTAVSSLFGLVLSYLRLREESGINTPLRSHFRWLIRTFWLGASAIVLSAILTWLLGNVVGAIAFIAALVWYVYRVAKGWLALYDGKQISQPQALL